MNIFGNGMTLADLLDRLDEQGFTRDDFDNLVLGNADGEPLVDLYVEDGMVHLSEWPYED